MGKLISWVARFRNVVKLNERRFLKKKKNLLEEKLCPLEQ